MLLQVRQAIAAHHASLNTEMDQLQQIMSPLQLAKFYVWVENNEWCMQVSAVVCPPPPSLRSPPLSPRCVLSFVSPALLAVCCVCFGRARLHAQCPDEDGVRFTQMLDSILKPGQ
jgi:hypothetical protein